jgi:hypothetical protein
MDMGDGHEAACWRAPLDASTVTHHTAVTVASEVML